MVHCSKDGAVYNKKMGTQYCNRFSDPANFCRYWRNILM